MCLDQSSESSVHWKSLRIAATAPSSRALCHTLTSGLHRGQAQKKDVELVYLYASNTQPAAFHAIGCTVLMNLPSGSLHVVRAFDTRSTVRKARLAVPMVTFGGNSDFDNAFAEDPVPGFTSRCGFVSRHCKVLAVVDQLSGLCRNVKRTQSSPATRC